MSWIESEQICLVVRKQSKNKTKNHRFVQILLLQFLNICCRIKSIQINSFRYETLIQETVLCFFQWKIKVLYVDSEYFTFGCPKLSSNKTLPCNVKNWEKHLLLSFRKYNLSWTEDVTEYFFLFWSFFQTSSNNDGSKAIDFLRDSCRIDRDHYKWTFEFSILLSVLGKICT